MAEFIFLFFCIFVIPFIFWIGEIPLEYLYPVFYMIIIFISLPLFISLPSAPFVPSKKTHRDTMIQLAPINKNSVVYELGCGDSRIIRMASAKGAKKAIGYEVSLPLIWYGKFMCFIQKNMAQIQYGNIWKQDYRDADVLFLYLLPHTMKRVQKDIWSQLKAGACIISNTFAIKGLQETKKVDGVYLYVKQ
jgi:hypothetical protein